MTGNHTLSPKRGCPLGICHDSPPLCVSWFLLSLVSLDCWITKTCKSLLKLLQKWLQQVRKALLISWAMVRVLSEHQVGDCPGMQGNWSLSLPLENKNGSLLEKIICLLCSAPITTAPFLAATHTDGYVPGYSFPCSLKDELDANDSYLGSEQSSFLAVPPCQALTHRSHLKQLFLHE